MTMKVPRAAVQRLRERLADLTDRDEKLCAE